MDPERLSSVVASAVTRAINEATRSQPPTQAPPHSISLCCAYIERRQPVRAAQLDVSSFIVHYTPADVPVENSHAHKPLMHALVRGTVMEGR